MAASACICRVISSFYNILIYTDEGNVLYVETKTMEARNLQVSFTGAIS
jgi:hypothetical protein